MTDPTDNATPETGGTLPTKNIIRTPRDRPYFSMARATAQDGKRDPAGLGFDDRGLIAYLLSKPDNWQVSVADVMAEGGIGRDKAKALIRNLRRAGYIVTEMETDDKGKFVGKVDRIYETAQTEHRSTENPSNGKSSQRKIRHINSIDRLKRTEGLNKTPGASSDAPGGTPPTIDLEEPQDDPPVNHRPREYPLYDAVEKLVFKLPGGPEIPRNWDAPVGGIARWLDGVIGNYGRYKVGRIATAATPADVARFVKWWTDNKSADLPQDFNKFVQWWRKWVAQTTPATPPPAPSQGPTPPARPEFKNFMRNKLKGPDNG
jgi:hypothetical protein